MKTNIKIIPLCVGVLLFSVGACVVISYAWNEPTAAPPSPNASAPINSGSASQGRTGNLGVGTTTPTAKLEIGNISSDKWNYKFTGSSSSGYTTSFNENDTGLYIGHDSSVRALTLQTNSADRLTIAGGGNVGIGTASPDHKLTVAGPDNIASFVSSGGNAYIRLSIYNDINRRIELANRDGRTALWNPQTGDAFNVMHSTGRVGIGNVSPSTRLQIGDGGDGLTNGLTIHSTYPTIYFRDANERSAMIHVNGNVMYFLRGCDNASDPNSGNSWCTYNNYWPLYLNMTNNDAVFGGSVYGFAFYYNSDIKLKKDILPLTDSLEKINQINGVSFKWKSDGKPSIGLIAQDVEKVFPEAVVSNEGTGMKSVDYAKLVAPIIEAVKTQQKEITELKSKITELESKIDASVK